LTAIFFVLKVPKDNTEAFWGSFLGREEGIILTILVGAGTFLVMTKKV